LNGELWEYNVSPYASLPYADLPYDVHALVVTRARSSVGLG